MFWVKLCTALLCPSLNLSVVELLFPSLCYDQMFWQQHVPSFRISPFESFCVNSTSFLNRPHLTISDFLLAKRQSMWPWGGNHCLSFHLIDWNCLLNHKSADKSNYDSVASKGQSKGVKSPAAAWFTLSHKQFVITIVAFIGTWPDLWQPTDCVQQRTYSDVSALLLYNTGANIFIILICNVMNEFPRLYLNFALFLCLFMFSVVEVMQLPSLWTRLRQLTSA